MRMILLLLIVVASTGVGCLYKWHKHVIHADPLALKLLIAAAFLIVTATVLFIIEAFVQCCS